MKPFFNAAATATLCSALSFLTAGCDAEPNADVRITVRQSGKIQSTLTRVNDDVTLEMKSSDGKGTPERLEFKCSDQSALKPALARAAEDHSRQAAALDKVMKSATIESIQAAFPTVDAFHNSKEKLEILRSAATVCDTAAHLNEALRP